MIERMIKFKITVFQEYDGDERVYEGVVMARDLGDAAQKLFKEFSYHDKAKKDVDCIVCDIHVEEYLDDGGNYTDIYIFGD